MKAQAAARLRQAARVLDEPAWVVGGTVRDALLGRDTPDIDLAVADAKGAAQKLARAWKGSLVVLDEDNGVYRVALKKGPVTQVDVARLQGGSIEADLMRRDFTVNAMAVPLKSAAAGPSPLIDPRGGKADLGRKVVRTETDQVLRDDPLRLLRAFRLAAQLGFSIEPETLDRLSRLRHLVRRPAGERIQSELCALLAVPGSSAWLKTMDETGVLTALFEEMEPSRKCAEVYYGPGGVMTHSLDTAARADYLLSSLGEVWPDMAVRLKEQLDGRSSAGRPFRAVLVLAAFLHDVAKPETARQVDGRLRFFGHDTVGAKRVEAILKRLRFPTETVRTVCAIVAHHLRPGHLAVAAELTDKAVYRFFRDLGEDAVPLLAVCWADHASYVPDAALRRLLGPAREAPGEPLARVKPVSARKTIAHLRLITELLRRFCDESRQPVPEPLIDGHDVMKTASVEPGPKVGELLEKIREAQAEGKVRTRKEALAFLAGLKARRK